MYWTRRTAIEVTVCVFVDISRNDGNEFSGSLFQKVNEKVDVGAQLSWSGANSMRFGLAAKFCAHPDTTFRVSDATRLMTSLRCTVNLTVFASLLALQYICTQCVPVTNKPPNTSW